MATLILSTSCAPIKSSRPSDDSSPDGDADINHPTTTVDWSDMSGSSGANVRKNACSTTGHSVGVGTTTSSSKTKVDSSCHFSSAMTDPSIVSSHQDKIFHTSYRGESPRRDSVVEFVGKIQAFPLQCDITIIPRAYPNDIGESLRPINETSLNSEANSEQSIPIIEPIIRVTKQQFRPCGFDNIVRLAEEGMSSPQKGNNDLILSLSNCGVLIYLDGEEIKLPVQAFPSSFAFPSSSNYDHDGSFSSYSQSMRGGEKKETVGEVSVSIDFSIALDIYQERIDTRPRVNDDGDSATASFGHEKNHRVNQSWNDDAAWGGKNVVDDTAIIIKTLEINSIMTSLEEESQFIRKTLVVLGSFGFGLLVCTAWTIWKLERRRRERRSRGRVVKNVIVDLPYDIIDTATTAKSGGGGGGITSILSSNSKANFPDEISPIRSPVSSKAEFGKIGMMTTIASNNRKGMHETLHLIAPQCGTGESGSNEGEQSNESPRHWYEDYLSPRNGSKMAKRNRRRSETLFSEKEEVARSLFFSSSRSSTKVSPLMDNEDVHNIASEKKVYVTPIAIERSTFSSPPPNSDVSLVGLHIESSKLPFVSTTETESTLDSSKTDDDPTMLHEEPPIGIVVTDKEKLCNISPVSFTAAADESSGAMEPADAKVNTSLPNSARTMKTPVSHTSITSDESCGNMIPVDAKVITPKRARATKTPADTSVNSQDSLRSKSQNTRRSSFAEELAKKTGLTPTSNNSKGCDFTSNIARRAVEVQTPKKTLTPLSVSSSPPDDEPSPFLADYW